MWISGLILKMWRGKKVKEQHSDPPQTLPLEHRTQSICRISVPVEFPCRSKVILIILESISEDVWDEEEEEE